MTNKDIIALCESSKYSLICISKEMDDFIHKKMALQKNIMLFPKRLTESKAKITQTCMLHLTKP